MFTSIGIVISHVRGACWYYSRHVHGDLLLQSTRAVGLLLLQSTRAWRLIITVDTCNGTVVSTVVTCMGTVVVTVDCEMFLKDLTHYLQYFAYSQCYVRRSWMPSNGTVQEASWRTIDPQCSRAPFCFNNVSLGNCGTAWCSNMSMYEWHVIFPENYIHLCDL